MTVAARTAWVAEPVGESDGAWSPALAPVTGSRPVCTAWCDTATGRRLACWVPDVGDWARHEVAEGFGAHTSAAADAGGGATVAFVDLDSGSVMAARVARVAGGTWTTETVAAGAAGIVAGAPSLALGPDGEPQVCYATDAGVHVARRTPSGAWESEPVGGSAEPANDVALAIGPEGGRVVLTRRVFANTVVLIREREGGWDESAVPWSLDPAAGWVGDRPALAVDPSGAAHVAFRSSTGVTCATEDESGAWRLEMVVPDGASGPDVSLVLDPEGRPVVACLRPDGDVELARQGDETWSRETIATGSPHGEAGGRLSMVIDATGAPHLVIADAAGGGLRSIHLDRGPVTRTLRFDVPRHGSFTGHTVLDGAEDPEGGPLTVSTRPVRRPTLGRLTLRASGRFRYEPKGPLGRDGFRYEVTDAAGLSAVGEVEIRVVVPVLIRVRQRQVSDRRRSSSVRVSLSGSVRGITAVLKRKRAGRWVRVRQSAGTRIRGLVTPEKGEWSTGPYRLELRAPDGEHLAHSEEFRMPPARGVVLALTGDLTGLPAQKPARKKPPPRSTSFDPAKGRWGRWPSTRSKPPLGRGSQGDAVRYLQGVIAHRSGLKIAVDGIFGPKTQSRVRTVQRRAKITVDGKVGPQTWPVVDRLARGS